MQDEKGLMCTAHPRIKCSTGYPDKHKDTAFFKSDRFLGGAWKNMPADYSLPRLGTRVLDTLDDMHNCAAKPSESKFPPGEVDVFQLSDEREIGRASCREEGCRYVTRTEVAISLKNNITIHRKCYRIHTTNFVHTP